METLVTFKNAGLLFLFLILSSCTDQNDTKKDDSGLSTTWVWVSSSGGIAGVSYTPKSTGTTKELTLSSDYTYASYTNGSISSQGTYKMGTQKCIHDHTIKNSIIFSNDTPMTIEEIDATNLILSDDYFDGFTNVYTKK